MIYLPLSVDDVNDRYAPWRAHVLDGRALPLPYWSLQQVIFQLFSFPALITWQLVEKGMKKKGVNFKSRNSCDQMCNS